MWCVVVSALGQMDSTGMELMRWSTRRGMRGTRADAAISSTGLSRRMSAVYPTTSHNGAAKPADSSIGVSLCRHKQTPFIFSLVTVRPWSAGEFWPRALRLLDQDARRKLSDMTGTFIAASNGILIVCSFSADG